MVLQVIPTAQGCGKVDQCWRAHSHNPDTEGRDELDGEEVEVVNPSMDRHSSTGPSQLALKGFQSQIIRSTPRNVKLVLSSIQTSIPPHSPNLSAFRPALASPMGPSPMVTSQQLQPVSSSSRRREDQSPFPFPATQVFQRREHWPFWVTR
ncbi:hypothetical protein O181_020631 [Austropuccinia psidii MF-1]|uniref:Uncharacterized protein n=1 Tax=Austropuccinia psidii MF-1 TaxID=1389203 RepID=A0A9Q3C9E7_9BASI|nr:hypothetical protein [Austropuccinia psidii MF-1]